MIFKKENIKAVLFDYGNTLIEYGPRQIGKQYAVLEIKLKEMFGRCDGKQLKKIRDRQALAPLKNGFRENDMKSITEELIRELYNVVPKESQVNVLIETRFQSFVEDSKVSSGVLSLLKKLSQRYRLGLISNYPYSRTTQHSLKKTGLNGFFEAVVISGDVGFIKPHEKPFRIILKKLGLRPQDCVFVGDNWLADVQGAKSIGMCAILTTEYEPYENIDLKVGDFDPDASINKLSELEDLLLD